MTALESPLTRITLIDYLHLCPLKIFPHSLLNLLLWVIGVGGETVRVLFSLSI